MMHRMSFGFTVVLGFVMALLLFPGRAPGMDFLRGDANSDGVVTLSDAHFALNYLFRGGPTPSCIKAMDVDGSAVINMTDPVQLMQYLVLGGASPPAPFPSAGPDTVADNPPYYVCSDYGHGSPLTDPAAEMQVLDVVAPGGTDGGAVITISVSSSGPLGGYAGTITTPPGLLSRIGCENRKAVDLTGAFDEGFSGLSGEPETGPTSLRFGFLCSLIGELRIPAGDSVPALEISVCLAPGTPAGEYPLSLGTAELVDYASGRSIAPSRVDGVLRVLAPVAESDVSCTVPCVIDPTDPPHPPVPGPEDVDCAYELGNARARPGDTFSVPFHIRAHTDLEGALPIEVQGYNFSVDFDEEVLQVVQVHRGFDKPDGTRYGYERIRFDNNNKVPGNGGVDEGFIVGNVVFSFEDDENNLLGDSEMPALSFEFRVLSETPASTTDLRFFDGAKYSSNTYHNQLIIHGDTFLPEAVNSFLFINGYIDVLPEIIAFVRGDSTSDRKLDIADSVATLGFLFLGSEPPACYDAADADDDGMVGISDPVFTLMYLFLGGSPPPAPFPLVGEDPTDDPMDCLTRP